MSHFYTLTNIEMEINRQSQEILKAQTLSDEYPTFKEVTIEYAQKALDTLQSLKQSMIASGINEAGAGYIIPEGGDEDLSREIMGISHKAWMNAPVLKHARRKWRVFLE